jgi:hypothetical protein
MRRPPRKVWLVVEEPRGLILAWVHRTKRDAEAHAARVTRGGTPCRAVGPYALLERVAEK